VIHTHRLSPFSTRFHRSPPGLTHLLPAEPQRPADTTGSTVGIPPSTARPPFDHFLENFMSTALLASPSAFRSSARRPMAVISLLMLLAGGLCVAFPGHALDLVAFTGITGPMTSALTQIAALGPGIKALVGFVGFVVALISLSALRNFGPVLFYVGLAIFAAVGLVIAGAIMGAVI
jgi:hypothetical protein